jgi:type II secretory pathway pseudopilin PulG
VETPVRTTRLSGDQGYLMVALLVAMSVMAIMMSAALPAYHTLAQREKEAELVFRGEQIARAIGLYQRKVANAPVPSIDFLVENRYLRKKYKDPITNDDFEPLTSGAGGALGDIQGAQSALQQAQGRAGGTAQGRGGAAAQGRGGAVVGGIVGVTSKSPLKSLRLYNGRDTYNQWVFMPVARGRAGGDGGGAGGRGGRGADGRGGDGRGGRGADGRGGDGRGGRSGLEELFQRGRGAGPADGGGGRGAPATRGGRF